MYNKKTVVLSSLDKTLNKAVLNLEKRDNTIFGEIKLYNFNSKPNGILTLGFLSNSKVFKAGLKEQTSNTYIFSTEVDNSFSNFTCALVNTKGGVAIPILLGCSAGPSSVGVEQRLAESLNVLNETDYKKIEKQLDDKNICYEENLQERVDEEINKHCSCSENACGTCAYKNAFYEDDSHNEESVKKEITFFSEIEEQINTLFSKNDSYELLSSIIPNSKWVKIIPESDEGYYVVGLIYENGDVKYVCYGVPGSFNNPPEDMKNYAQWLPIDVNNSDAQGLWISYQDAINGENIEMQIV